MYRVGVARVTLRVATKSFSSQADQRSIALRERQVIFKLSALIARPSITVVDAAFAC